MANVRDSDTSLWLHNKLGTSNDSWISGSIISQLNKEVLHNIKECFPDLQTQVKLKLLLNLFHIPRRLVEEWKGELDEILEVACLDSELWVSMLAETMKTFPSAGTLNTEISDYDDTRPIFTDMINDLRKLVNKHADFAMLPLECQYLNKNALISVVGHQPNTLKHFNLKKKPKSHHLRAELLHKSADAQSSMNKKISAPTIPLRSRGMPRKMTDTTPLKGIPSRLPTSGFRSINVTPNQQRPNISRTPAGRKDGGIKLIEFTDQPLGYAAAKKRKREQQLEEQAKKQEQKQQTAAAKAAIETNVTTMSRDDLVTTPTEILTSPTTNISPDAITTNNTNITCVKTPTTPPIKSLINYENDLQIKEEIFTPTKHIQEDYKYEQVTKVEKINETSEIKTLETKDETPNYTTNHLSRNDDNSNSAHQDNNKLLQAKTVSTTLLETTPTTTKRKARTISVKKPKINTQTNINNNKQNKSAKRKKIEMEFQSEKTLLSSPTTIIKDEIIMQSHQQQHQQTQQQALTTREQFEVETKALVSSQTQEFVQQQNVPPLQQRVLVTQPSQQQPLLNQIQVRKQLHEKKLPKLQVIERNSPQASKHFLIQHASQQELQHYGNTTISSQKELQQQPVLKLEKLDITDSRQQFKQTTSTTGILAPTKNVTPITNYTNNNNINNPLANLPDNISVKITSAGTSSKKTFQPQKEQHIKDSSNQTQKHSYLLNNSAPVIMASPSLISLTTLPSSTSTLLTSNKQEQAVDRKKHGTVTTTAQNAKSMPLSQLKSATNSGPVIISQTIIKPAKRSVQPHQPTQYVLSSTFDNQQQDQQKKQILPTLTSFTTPRTNMLQHQNSPTTTIIGGTKFMLKSSPTSSVVVQPVRKTINIGVNPPPLIATNAPQQDQQILQQQQTAAATTMLNLQNVQLPNRPVTIQPASQAAQQQHMQAQLQQQQQQHTLVPNNAATQQPKLTQVLVQSPVTNQKLQPQQYHQTAGLVSSNVSNLISNNNNNTNTNIHNSGNLSNKNKTIIITPKGMVLRNIGGDVYQQIPITNVGSIQVGQGTTIMTTAGGFASKSAALSNTLQVQQLQQQPHQQQNIQIKQTMPSLIPSNNNSNVNPAQTHMIVQQQPTQTTSIIGSLPNQHTIIRPVNVTSRNIKTLPQGLTLITRNAQQPQLLQVTTTGGLQQQVQQPQQRTVMSQQLPQFQKRQIVVQQKLPIAIQQQLSEQQPQIVATNSNPQQLQITQNTDNEKLPTRPTQILQITQHSMIKQSQQTQQAQQQPQRKGLSLSNEHVHKAHEMFRKANRVSRPDKALILGFMAGLRENPRPNSENVIVIKLDETEEKVQQDDGSTALCLVESLIRLDYNTGEWKHFRNFRRLDQNAATSTNISTDIDASNFQAQHTSVVI